MKTNMTRSVWTSATAIMLTIGLASLSPLQVAFAAEAMDMTKAASPAENEAWAVKLDKEAMDLDAKVTEHTANASQFRGLAGSGSKQATDYTSIANHCDKLAQNYREAAEEARAMAALHRDLAKGA